MRASEEQSHPVSGARLSSSPAEGACRLYPAGLALFQLVVCTEQLVVFTESRPFEGRGIA